MYLTIVKPDKVVFKGEVNLVTLPGAGGSFTVLDRHAPIISLLTGGDLLYRCPDSAEYNCIRIRSGFMKASNNFIEVCLDE